MKLPNRAKNKSSAKNQFTHWETSYFISLLLFPHPHMPTRPTRLTRTSSQVKTWVCSINFSFYNIVAYTPIPPKPKSRGNHCRERIHQFSPHHPTQWIQQISKQTNKHKQIHKLTKRQTYKQTNRQTNKQIHKLTNRQTNKETNKQLWFQPRVRDIRREKRGGR